MEILCTLRSAIQTQKEEIMSRTLLEQGDAILHPGFTLPGTGSLAITFDDTGVLGNELAFLVLSGTTPVTIDSIGAMGGLNVLHQLSETNNDPTTVIIKGSESFLLGSFTGQSNSGDGVVTDIAATAMVPKTIHSSLKLIDASSPTGTVDIFAGATNTSAGGLFDNGASLNANVAITYTGLVIKGGRSSLDFIENDAKNGIVTCGNGPLDVAVLGGSGAKATFGHGGGDEALVGFSEIGTIEAAGTAFGDTVKFGAAATAFLFVDSGAEAGFTVFTKSIGLTKVLNAAAGLNIDFTTLIPPNSNIADETLIPAVASAKSLTAAENAAVAALGGPGVAYFSFHHNEYFIATNNVETAVSSNDAIVELVGVTNIHHATNNFGLVTLHV
jgi:hypothetical protein